MAKGFRDSSGAKVRKAGKSFVVQHGTSGKTLSRHKTKAAAQKAAKETRARNRGSAARSAKNEEQHQ